MSALTRALASQISSTVGTSSTAVLAANGTRNFLQIHNPSSTANLAFTIDGTAPVINGNGLTLLPGGTATYDNFVPTNAINLIASAGSSPYTIVHV